MRKEGKCQWLCQGKLPQKRLVKWERMVYNKVSESKSREEKSNE